MENNDNDIDYDNSEEDDKYANCNGDQQILADDATALHMPTIKQVISICKR